MNVLDQIGRVHHVDFPRARAAPAHIRRRDSGRVGQNYRHAGDGMNVLRVPDFQARHVGDQVFRACSHPRPGGPPPPFKPREGE